MPPGIRGTADDLADIFLTRDELVKGGVRGGDPGASVFPVFFSERRLSCRLPRITLISGFFFIENNNFDDFLLLPDDPSKKNVCGGRGGL